MREQRVERRLRRMLPVAVLLAVLTTSAGPAEGSADVVAFEGRSSADLDLAIEDLLQTLSTMTERSWRRESKSAHGVRLVLRSASDPAFVGRTLEAFRVVAHGGDVELAAADPRGLVLAVYELLDRLGARWPLPGEGFAVIPHRKQIWLELTVVLEPRFRMREFFGTGGVGAGSALDPGGSFERAWRDYTRRNRWGGVDHIRGHAGSAFATAHRAEIEAHSDWRAELRGVRSPWSSSLKLCASSTGAVDAFVADRVDALGKLIASDPSTFAISVEPADGGGHCECARCRALGGISERVFTLANAVARGVRERYPGHWVSLYAYNEHAAVPSIRLEPNVFVMVCPYGFQRTGLDPDELISAWKKKVSRLGVYDYWAIPDWSKDTPTVDVAAMIARLDGWHDQGIEAFMIESSFAGGSVGPALWSASRRFFGSKSDLNADRGEWARLVFGDAAPELEPLLREWGEGYIPSRASLGRSFEALTRALARVPTESPAHRHVLMLSRYAEYLRLRFEVDLVPRDAPEHLARVRDLARWILAIAPDLSVASFRLYQLILRDEDPTKELGKELKLEPSSGVGEAETLERLARARSLYAPGDLHKAVFKGTWLPTRATLMGPPAPGKKLGDRVMVLAGPTELTLLARTSTTVAVELGANATAPTRVLLYDERGKRAAEQKLEGPGATATLSLRAEQGYVLKIVDPKNVFRLRLPRSVRASLTRFISPATAAPLYFYVPAGTTRLVLNVPSVLPARLSDSSGATVLDEVTGLIDVEVPEAQRGKIWSIANYRGWQPLRAVSVPQAFALDPDDLLVPEQALRAK